jgi:hypothetical protein
MTVACPWTAALAIEGTALIPYSALRALASASFGSLGLECTW